MLYVVIRYSHNGTSSVFNITVFFMRLGTTYIDSDSFCLNIKCYYQWGSAKFNGDKPCNINELIAFVIKNKNLGGVSNPSTIKLNVLIDASYGEIYYTNTNNTSNIGSLGKILK